MNATTSISTVLDSQVAILTASGSRFGQYDAGDLKKILVSHFVQEESGVTLKDEASFLQIVSGLLLIKHGSMRVSEGRKWVSLISGGDAADSDYWIDWRLFSHFMAEDGILVSELQKSEAAPSFIANAVYRQMQAQDIDTQQFLCVVADLRLMMKGLNYDFTYEEMPTEMAQHRWLHELLPAIWAVDAGSATYLSSSTKSGTGIKVQSGNLIASCTVAPPQQSYFFSTVLPADCLFVIGGSNVTILARNATAEDKKRSSELSHFLERLQERAAEVEVAEIDDAELPEVRGMTELDDTLRAIPACVTAADGLNARSSSLTTTRSRILSLRTGIEQSQEQLDRATAEEQELLRQLAQIRTQKSQAAKALREQQPQLAGIDVPALTDSIHKLNTDIRAFNTKAAKLQAAASGF